MSIKRLVRSALRERLRKVQKTIKELRKDIRALRLVRTSNEFTLRITIISNVKREFDIIHEGKSGLEKLMQEAIQMFKRENACYEVNAEYKVEIVLPNKSLVELPDHLYMEYHQKYGQLPLDPVSL